MTNNEATFSSEYRAAALAYWSLSPVSRKLPTADAAMQEIDNRAYASGVELDIVAISEAARLAVS